MMNRFLTACILAIPCVVVCHAGADEGKLTQRVVFARDIQPLLAKQCLLCHGPDEAEAGLRLDLAEQAYAGLDSGEHAIVPGRADESELLRRVSTTDESLRMPPEGEPLSADEVERMRQWIIDGAEYTTHWAYQPVREPSLPGVKNETWVRNPIDRFVLARLEQEEVAPSPEAERATLIRRLYYDLVGLPPTPQEVDAVICRTHPFKSRDKDKPADRLDLARWLADANHPLTARVTVNHVWADL